MLIMRTENNELSPKKERQMVLVLEADDVD
jgi:hypothetical protein